MVMNADQFNQRMKKIVEYSNKGEMNYVSLRIMLYLTNELDETNKDVLIQSAEAIGANVGGYSYNFIRRGIATLREKNIITEKKSNVDKRYYEYKFQEIDQWKE
jgi:hypothetical protein